MATDLRNSLTVAWSIQTYRIELGVWPFALSAADLLVLGLFAIGSQTVHAAGTDPATTFPGKYSIELS